MPITRSGFLAAAVGGEGRGEQGGVHVRACCCQRQGGGGGGGRLTGNLSDGQR